MRTATLYPPVARAGDMFLVALVLLVALGIGIGIGIWRPHPRPPTAPLDAGVDGGP